MRKTQGLIPYLDLRAAGVHLYEQLYNGLRMAILDGRLPPETRLPSTRALADDLDVSRVTVIRAYDQLKAEGYVDAGVGSGTWVASELPDRLVKAMSPVHGNGNGVAGPASMVNLQRSLSSRGRELVELAGSVVTEPQVRPFMPDVPALDHFPHRAWTALKNELEEEATELRRSDLAGEPSLRRALATFVSGTRGGRVDPDQVVMTSSTNESIHLLSELLLDPQDTVLFEDPGYKAARAIFEQACTVVPTLVDDEGMTLPPSGDPGGRGRLAFVTPSNQFPLGHSMSLARRRELLEWAEENDAWIVEDDYDGEYRFTGRPLPSLLSLDQRRSVIYLSGFRKLLAPTFEMAFVILPLQLVEPFLILKSLRGRLPATLPQRILARFIEGDHLGRHVRTMREVYKERRDLLVDTLRTELGAGVQLSALDAGTHLVLWMSGEMSAVDAAARLAEAEIHALPVSHFARRSLARDGLVLGYGGFEGDALVEAAKELAAVIR